ncbi:MAG TPA: hypothetical protein VF784_12715, partial [Anaerolineales bacterium]
NWAPGLAEALPGVSLIGLDEQTGILSEPTGSWTVYGAGQVTLYRHGASHVYARGAIFSINKDL